MNTRKRLRAFLAGLLLASLFFSGTALAAPSKTPRPRDPEYVEGEALVLLKNNTLQRTLSSRSVESGIARSYANNVAASVGAKVETTYGALSAQAGEIFTLVKSKTKTTKELIRDLKKKPDVISASPNYIVRGADTIPDDLYFGSGDSSSYLWGLGMVNAPKAWDRITGDADVYVAVADTGIDHNHPDLTANVDLSLAKDFATNVNGAQDGHGHGTHVSGTIGAVGNNGIGVVGVNWTTKIIPLKVLADNNKGTSAMIAGGVNQVVKYLNENPGMRIPAINLSIIGWWKETPEEAKTTAYWKAFKTLSDMNTTVIVVCAGNEMREVGQPNPNNLNDGPTTGYYPYPASFLDIDNMIVVGAIDKDGKAAAFTNFSETLVDLVAPGVAVWSTYPIDIDEYGYRTMSGTSMATPHVTGAAALLAAYRPDLTAPELKALLLGAANPDVNPVLENAYNPTHQKVSRLGLLDIGAAVEAATIEISNPVTGISISPPTPDPLYTNGDAPEKTVELTAAVTPGNATIPKLHWTTNNTSVATVAVAGPNSSVVTAVGKGTARITAKATDGSGVSAYVDVEVRTYATGMSLNYSYVELPPGGTFTFAATVEPPEADQSVAWSITYKSEDCFYLDNGFVSVDINAPDGESFGIRATATGEKKGNVWAGTEVKVKESSEQRMVKNITVTPDSLSLLKGADGQLNAQIEPDDAENKGLYWSSDNNDVARANDIGLVTAIAPGTATITARAVDGSNIKGTSFVTVSSPSVPVIGIMMNRYQIELTEGTSYQLVAAVVPTNADNKQVLWSAADAAVATVASNGLVTAHAAGTTTVTAKAAADSTKAANITVKVTGNSVYVPVTSLTLSPASPLLLKMNQAALITPTVSPPNASNKTVSWVSAKPVVATVTQGGYVTAVSAGSADITAMAEGGNDVRATIKVDVAAGTPAFVGVDSLTVAPSSLTLIPGDRGTLKFELSPENAVNKDVVWESSNPAVATVSGGENPVTEVAGFAATTGNVVVTAVSEGHSVVKATALGGNNVFTEVLVTVESDTPPVPVPTLPPGDITVSFVGSSSPVAAVGLPFACSVRTSAPVENAALLISYPDGDGRFADVETDGSGSVLAFTFTPPMAGKYVLRFTFIDAEGKLSEPTLELTATGSAPAPEVIDLTPLKEIGLINGVLPIRTGQGIDVRLTLTLPGGGSGAVFSSSALPPNLVLTSDGRFYGSVVTPGSYRVTITVTTPNASSNGSSATFAAAEVYSTTFTLVVSAPSTPVPTPTPTPTPTPGNTGGGGGGGCSAGMGIWASILLAGLFFFRNRS